MMGGKQWIVAFVAAMLSPTIAAGADARYLLDLSDTFWPRLVLGIGATWTGQQIGGEFSFYCRNGGALDWISVTAIIRSELAARLHDEHKDWAMGFSTTASTVIGSRAGVDKEAGLTQVGFDYTLELSAATTGSFDYTGISDQPDILYLSGLMRTGDFQRWVTSPIAGTLFFDQNEKQWWIFTRTTNARIVGDDLKQFILDAVLRDERS